jgi:RNA polymerase-binding transcription factor DksA
MYHSLLQDMFGCSHRNTTFPLTPRHHSRRAVNELEGRTYVACLECGTEIPYDWDKMERMQYSVLARFTLACKRITEALRLTSAA